MRIEENADYLQSLLAVVPPGHEPPGHEIVPFKTPPVPVSDEAPGETSPVDMPKIRKIIGDLDIRRMSPRQAVDLSLNLYINGILPWEEYAMLAFQPELHPDYSRTIGALIGKKPQPDRPRDFIAQWEKRLKFERKYNSANISLIERTKHLIAALRQIDLPTDVAA